MHQVLIIEDERPAVERLVGMLTEINPKIRTAGVAMSVRQAVEWLHTNPMPDLILMDIALSDGSSFEIFSACTISCPIIFITAYDEYWQEAFEHNGIDYLLKPVKREKLKAALDRYDQLREHFTSRLQTLLTRLPQNGSYKQRFLVKRGTDLLSIPAEDIAYFYAADKIVCLVDRKHQRFVLDQSLSELEKQLDPDDFYRVNRKYLLHRVSILRAKAYSKSKLLLDVHPPVTEEIIISQEFVSRFKAWFGG